MKTSNNKHKTFVLGNKGAAVLIITAILALVFTGCKQPAGGKSDGGSSGGGNTGPNYVKVPYSQLQNYMQNTASETEVNYIEVTGVIPKEDFKGSGRDAGELGKRIKSASGKKVALKIETYPAGLTDMSGCFRECENLESLANLPEGVTSLQQCFYGCKNLVKAPVIPETVNMMAHCFYKCEKLKTGPDIPASVNIIQYCFRDCTQLKGVKLKCSYSGSYNAFTELFKNCDALVDGGIKVPTTFIGGYTAEAAIKDMFGADCNVEEKKAKFAAY